MTRTRMGTTKVGNRRATGASTLVPALSWKKAERHAPCFRPQGMGAQRAIPAPMAGDRLLAPRRAGPVGKGNASW